MAIAAGHKFGQDLGYFLEEIVLKDILMPKLIEFTQALGYYLDYQRHRPARSGRKVIWEDKYGNGHSLDFVIEAGGTDYVVGRPIAFIESAWRRYTKHSKNKAQEIQGAIVPIREKHQVEAPFVGVVLAGEFTAPSIQQLRSQAFSVIHIPYQVIVRSFRAVGVEIEFDEKTDDAEFHRASSEISHLTTDQIDRLRAEICRQCSDDIAAFMESLYGVLRRHIVRIRILPLWGIELIVATFEEARTALARLPLTPAQGAFARFEVMVSYSNGSEIRGEFLEKDEVLSFLEQLGAR